MSFAQDNGYTPATFDEIMSEVREGINAQFGTTYNETDFVGTNWYKFAYAIVQKIQLGEIKTSEIFQKLQQYIELTNERIQRPSVSFPGLVDSFTDNGYVASVKPMEEADAGKVSICLDLDPLAPGFAAEKLAVCTLIKDFVAAGIVTLGDQSETIVLSNGQSFDFKFTCRVETPILLRLTATQSRNQLVALPTDEDIRAEIFNNINARYRLGWDFEPERYFGVSDALWANDVTLEWSDDGGSNYFDTVYEAEFTDKLTFALEDISVVIT